MEHQLALAQANGEDTVKLERALLEEKKRVTAEKIALLEELVRKEFESNLAILRINAQTNDFLAGMLSAIEKDMQSKGGQEAYINQLIGNDKSLNELKKTLDTTTKELEIFEVKVAKAKRDAASKEVDWRKGIDEEIIQGEMRKAEAIKTITTGLQQFNLEAYQKELEDKRLAQAAADAEEKRLKQEKFNQDLQGAEDLSNALSNLNNAKLEADLQSANGNEREMEKIRKKAFARQKALDIVQATISGIKAVQSALTAPPPLGFALAGIVGATALANIKKIASTQFQGSGGGGSAPSSLGATASATNGADVGTVTNTSTVLGGNTKVFVTEQDISNTQNKVEVTENEATL